ncbi:MULTISPECIES: nitrate reductase [Rhodobacterales]|jgi:assimilatory nitrate reductase catalytic subunit|uniref:nitrate reductase n=1 Tax=Rhodobacterales TaxID=204455 RepID=UPI00237F4517|nr:nitrate reductase [Phaeobacter gallaeciensis]MDE4140241.1 molybdopterin-dependent oxidoreductase [Phaeobacter gallaeciensis]MDE4149066.1 molybdopterin-dependent oxidoreductase [Phaeobacter gallaeciensis]MDE4153288.1 molybdopterin-dependent oxidoreductase [Phaeobacter gallaeciensis]MDE4228298.1 molybdopterin-dependent oxidoreductase [Phaeobacter gallaeciensis]MDE4257374.1 molybdopterin-dependent oxidoreductase [Phaeobacter gallaeciensis]
MSAPGGIRSTCPYCGVGCGVLLSKDKNGALSVRGDPDHPANFGRLCSKGSALGETLGLEHRLLAPKIDGQNSDWDTALDLVADLFSKTIRDHGPDSVAFYVSGQLLTEDYYVANKLMKGFIGSANIDTNSRLCMASSVAGHKRAFGSDTVPGTYEDLDEADLVVLVGSNLAWCHPVLYQRLLAARKSRGTRIVVIDPRRTASCDGADLHLALQPGSDVALFNHLLTQISARGAIDADYQQHTSGLEAALEAARADTLSPTGLSEEEVRAFCDMWIGTEKTVTIYSQGVNQSTSGSDKVNAILNCHLATGRIGRPGMGPLSVTGQPNAMGGREVGGLANMLACHLDLENPDHRQAVRDFWQAPQMPEAPGLKAVDMFRAVADGRIKALWVIHTNPAVSMPDSAAVRAAIKACPFTVVSDITEHSDTARLARVLLPASAWGEKDGTVTNSDRTISRQRAALPAPAAARPDWQILCEVGKRMGWHAAFDYESPVEIFREYAALSGVAGQFGRDFDISGLSGLEASTYDTLAPTRWPVISDRSGGRFFADGNFYHGDKKARLLPLRYRPPAARTGPKYPFRLNTGRLRDQWHTMTRTGLSPRLGAHMPEPFLDLHPNDAATLGITPADLVEVRSPNGSAILRARIGDAVQPGQVFAPIHWTGETAPSGRIDDLVAAETDPVSGQPESKASVVAVQKMEAAWYGFAVSTRPMAPNADYWALAPTRGGYRAEMAGYAPAPDWEEEARRLFDLPDAEAATILDPARGTARIALFDKGRLLAALFVDREPVAVVRDYLATLPDAAGIEVLTGRPPADVPDPGPVICSCFGIGINTIISAIETQHLMTVEAIGVALEAGTNCGSCRPELAAILASTHQREAAE